MSGLLIIGIVLVIASIAAFIASLQVIETEETGVILMVLSIVLFGIGMFITVSAAKDDTKEEVMKYLVNRNVVELQIDSTTNDTVYKLTPEADSTGWKPLYYYLKGTRK